MEMQAAVAVFLFMSASLFFFTFVFDRMRFEYQAQHELTDQARLAVEKMIWGHRQTAADAREGLWDASDISVISPSEIRYTDITGNTHGVRSNAGVIEYQWNADPWTPLFDPNGAAPADAGRFSLNLSFSQILPRVIQIQLVVGQRVVGRWHYASLSTQVAIRN